MVVCLVVILWASILVVCPTVASSSIQILTIVSSSSMGGDGCIFECVNLLDIRVAWPADTW